jgi:peptide/nickel transport system substrate-binding protein
MNTRRSSLFSSLLTSILILAFLVSCTPTPTTENTPVAVENTPVAVENTSVPVENTPVVETKPTETQPAPTEAIVSRNDVKIAQWGDITTLDPSYLSSTERELVVQNCIYSGLVKYKVGTWEIVPDVAERWEISADNLEITFYLRKGVQFQKGYGELTAEDVKFSYERIIDPAQNSPEISSWAALDHIDIIDDYTVKLVLKNPSANLFTSTLPLNAGFIVSRKAVEEMGNEKFGLNPIGSGPYEFDHWTPGQEVVLTAFADYFGDPPKIEKVSFIPIEEVSTTEAALKTGEIDVAEISLQSVEEFQANSDLIVTLKPGLKYWWIGFLVTQPPFDNIKVREAIRYTINVDEILQAAFNGIPERANTMFPKGMLGRWEDAPAYEPDLEKAKALLADAGYPDGASLGELTFLMWQGEDTAIIGEVVKSQLAQIGINVKVESVEVGLFNDMTTSGKGNNFHISFFATTVDPGYATEWFQCEQTWNLSKWCNPTYDELWQKGASEMDTQKRADIYTEMQKIIDQDIWAIWLTNDVKAVTTQIDLDPGEIFPNGRVAPWQMEWKK